MIFLLAPTAALARTVAPDFTIEAEYGSEVVEGAVHTSAHHQPHMRDWPAPCMDKALTALRRPEGVALLSHVDLDSFGGALRLLPEFDDLFGAANESFWRLAEWVDTRGPHRIGEAPEDLQPSLPALRAYWAWAAEAPRFDRDKVHDVSENVRAAGDAVRLILSGDAGMLAAGEQRREAEAALNAATAVRAVGRVFVRSTDGEFVNHLYTSPDGVRFAALAVYNSKVGTVTVSLAEPIEGVSCRKVVQSLFGPLAGGHDGIAGSPRGEVISFEAVESAAEALNTAISRVCPD
jgi:hypothetical protein